MPELLFVSLIGLMLSLLLGFDTCIARSRSR